MPGPMLKGMLVGFDIWNPLASIIAFQYNPETLTRTLAARAAGAEGGRTEALRLEGAPKETIKLKVELDAVDQIERGNPSALGLGLHPQLAALEMLLYPKSAVVIANTVLSLVGSIEVIPVEAPLTLFVWGPQRVLPVRLSGFTVTEQLHDSRLNPVHASVDLDLSVLSYSDLKVTNPGYYIFMAHQIMKEGMAMASSFSNL